jgi:hypothetical protein
MIDLFGSLPLARRKQLGDRADHNYRAAPGFDFEVRAGRWPKTVWAWISDEPASRRLRMYIRVRNRRQLCPMIILMPNPIGDEVEEELLPFQFCHAFGFNGAGAIQL